MAAKQKLTKQASKDARVATPRRLREESNLQGEQSKGWSDWKRAMVPPHDKSEDLEKRGPNQVGKMCSSIHTALGDLAEHCGIYEWRARGTRPGQPNHIVYVGSTCVCRKPDKLRSRIIGYCRNGNHKTDRINLALRRGYEMCVRVKDAKSAKDAQDQENALLAKYDYAWNKRQNGGDDGVRDILPIAQ